MTISLEDNNRQEIEKQLKTTEIDWGAVVKVSTAHYVFPALYCNLKRTDFLNYLPLELVSYMKHIADINRERNKQIISQAQEINSLLLDNNIKVSYAELSAVSGHDAFLMEDEHYHGIIKSYFQKVHKQL